jgi:hypothetical protein
VKLLEKEEDRSGGSLGARVSRALG